MHCDGMFCSVRPTIPLYSESLLHPVVNLETVNMEEKVVVMEYKLSDRHINLITISVKLVPFHPTTNN